MSDKKYRGVSLFAGAGGMDVGFERAGIEVVWANEIDKDACATYKENHPGILHKGDIKLSMDELGKLSDIDIVFGGPPCQGFSVAGKMDPGDERSTLLWTFLDVVEVVKPRGFVCENVKALGRLKKWRHVRQDFIDRAEQMGYGCSFVILNSCDFGVPQKRERVFFIGVKGKKISQDILLSRIETKKRPPKSVRETIRHLGVAGAESNKNTCNAKITMAAKPVLRKSPYAGMMFNGLGRPLELDGYSATLPASMGGNKTPIIDEGLLHGDANEDWIVKYHKHLWGGGDPLPFSSAPSRLRRLTLDEAALIQTFPQAYKFCGSKSSIYRQIGNAVPCDLAEVIARVALEEIDGDPKPTIKSNAAVQLNLFELLT